MREGKETRGRQSANDNMKATKLLTDDDILMLNFVIRRAHRRMKKWQDKECRDGRHGFNVQVMNVTPCGIYSRCTNCGKEWHTYG